MTTSTAVEGITSITMKRPGGSDELEIIFSSSDYQEVDAVFTSVDVVQKILIPYYEQTGDAKTVDSINESIQNRSVNGMMLLPHKKTCKMVFPNVDWRKAESPVTL